MVLFESYKDETLMRKNSLDCYCPEELVVYPGYLDK